VTDEDYKTIIFDNFGDIKDVHVYGGENVVGSVDYGKVYISITTTSGAPLTDQEKTDIIALLRKKRVMGIQPYIIDPDYIYLIPSVIATVNFRNTSYTGAQLAAFIKQSVSVFNYDYLQKFNTTFRYSKMVESIDNTSDAILSNQTLVQMYKIVTPDIRISSNPLFTIFNNEITPGTFINSEFLLDDGNMYVLTDYNPNNDTFDKTSTGSMLTVTNNNPLVYLRQITTDNISNYRDAGIINYATGEIRTKNINVISFLGEAGIKFYATGKYMDVKATFNDVVLIDLATVSVTIDPVM
jgi:hypothetical protein